MMRKSSCSNISSCDGGDNFRNSKPTVIPIHRQNSALKKVNGRSMHTCRHCTRQFPSCRALGGHMRTHVPSSVSPPLLPPLSSSSSDAELTSSSFDHADSTFRAYCRPAKSLFLSQETGNEEEEEETGEDDEEEERCNEEGEDVVSIRRSIYYVDLRRLHSQRATGKWLRRSRCAKYSPSPLQISDYQEDQTEDVSTTPSESEEERDVANCLILLAQAGRGIIEEHSGFEDSNDHCKDDRANMVDGDHLGIDGINDTFVVDAAKKVDFTTPSESEEERDHAANCLIMLAQAERDVEENSGFEDSDAAKKIDYADSLPKHQCQYCRRVFSCHQALGGHRASHRKVKGCFARMNLEGEDVVLESAKDCDEEEANKKVVSYGFQPIVEDRTRSNIPSRKGSKVHRCNICEEEFDSGQALGGHKRKHWKGERATNTASVPRTQQHGIWNDPRGGGRGIFLDLNSPPPLDDDYLSFNL